MAVAFRRVGGADPAAVAALTALERAANLAALGHVFPPARHPFPDDAVAARWALVLSDPTVVVEVVDPDGDPLGDPDRGVLRACVAHDATTVRHLAVHPDHWGRGLARAALERAVAAIAGGGAAEAQLWCLVDNTRARGLYEHLGWRPTEERQEAPWPPHPEEMAYRLPLARPPGTPAARRP